MSDERQIFAPRPIGLAPRWDSWLLSLSLHAALATIVSVTSYVSPALREISKSDFDRVIERQRKNRKLVLYRYPNTLPAISPVHRESKQENARARELSNEQPIVSKVDPKVDSVDLSKQLVYQAAAKNEMAAKPPEPPQLPQPPAPPAPPAKKFTPPPVNRSALSPNPAVVLEAPPAVSINGQLTSTILPSSPIALPPKAKPKTFVPPSVSASTSNVGKAAATKDIEAPPALAANPTQALALAALGPKSSLDKLLATNDSGKGSFSRAAEKGEPDFGRKNLDSGLRVPDLMVGAPKPALPDEPFEIKPDSFRLMPSYVVPMNAGARVIPRTVEPLFANRVAYSLVIPMSKTLLRRYNGDWIAWFSDVGSTNQPAAKMQPPVPILKREIREYLVPAGETGVEKRVMLAALITIEGAIEPKQFLRDPGPVISDLVRRDLGRWKFFPARRDGKPVAIDVVLEIPYLVPISLAPPLPRP